MITQETLKCYYQNKSNKDVEDMKLKGYESVFEFQTNKVPNTIWTVWVNISTGRSVLTTVLSSNETIYHELIETIPERI